ncbi:Uma2 family endonuclease [Streptomyces sp. NBC_00356]|uniref:Uma2 family endonuclease n=1 Tax=Streptomyces sp. NBC_00356 TaxID=2975724 RepID=UPI002E25292F
MPASNAERSGPLEHQQFAVRMRNALEADARRATRDELQVEVETNVFFKPDKSSFLTPDFLVRRGLPGADAFADDTVLVGEVVSGPYNHKRRLWKMDRYAEAGIPWYWEIELDTGETWDVTAVRAYVLVPIIQTRLAVKPLHPTAYVPVGEWEPGDLGIEFPEPFAMSIGWEDLAF